MRTKHAREIRVGIRKAQLDVRSTIATGRPSYGIVLFDSDLSRRAYNVTVAKMVAREVIRIGERMLKKVHEKWPETKDGDRT